jgi:septal ring factor EnvC (AmiA/AmiB activator)
MAGLFGFFTTFGKKQIGNIGESITRSIVAWDPETATEAEIEAMIQELDKITKEAGKAKAQFEKEQKEADAAQKNYDRHLAAAQMLESQMLEAQTGGDSGKALQLETSVGNLVNDLEKLKPELDREVREAVEAKEFYDELMDVARITAEKVKKAREMLERAKRDMERAKMEEVRANAKAARAEKLAGIRKDASDLGIALSSMNQAAEEARAKAAASDMKAMLLSPEHDKEDPNVEAALKAVAGDTPLKLQPSVSDRLAALKRD